MFKRTVLALGCMLLMGMLPMCGAQAPATTVPDEPATKQALPTATLLRGGWLLQDAANVSATGDVVSRPDFDTRGWHQAIVPGTVLTSLVADGTYPDPLYGLNNLAIPDSLGSESWWYRAVFDTPPRDGAKRWLQLDGVNYAAEIWINGKPLGTVRGAFVRGDFEITDSLIARKANVLAILISPPPHPGASHQKSLAHGTGRNGGISAADGPSFLCTIGWDWIPTIRDRDCGIWQDVSIRETGDVRIENPFVQSKLPLPRTDSADLTVQVTVRNVTDVAQSGSLDGTIDEDKHFEQSISLAPRESKKVILDPNTTPTLHWDHPRLWWPNGYGEPNLYALRLQFKNEQGVVSDQSDSKIGIRQLGYSVADSDNLTLTVNGVPVIAKGGDWGLDEALKRIPPERIDAMVDLHRQANYTIIRNWVGQSTEESFYDACDRYGILVWDEMFQPNPSDGPDPLDTSLYLANVQEKLLRYRGHPSIALWCGRNEGDPPADISRGIAELIRQFDGSRLYQASSTDGRGVRSGGPYYWRTPKEFYGVDAPFKTEIGSVSIPTFEAVKAMLPEHSRATIDEIWAERDLCAGAQRGDIFPHQLAQRYGGFSNLADFVRKGQLATYEAYRAMYEGRLAQLFHPVTGVITWMSNPAQPSFVWQLYSHDLEPNAALFATRLACEPLHIMLNQANGHLMIVNSTPTTQPHLTAVARVYNFEGALEQTITRDVDVTSLSATEVGRISSEPSLAIRFVRLSLMDGQQRELSRNFYWTRGDEDFSALDNLPQANVRVQAHRVSNRSETQVAVTVKNTADGVALMTHLQLRNALTHERILPAYSDDNYLSLVPGETRELTIRTPTTSVGRAPLELAVDGWNIGLDAGSGGADVGVILNSDALARSLRPSTQPDESEAALRISCGGARTRAVEFGKPVAAPGIFEKDIYVRAGTTYANGQPVSVDPGSAAPASVYATGRRGQLVYDLPADDNRLYRLNLHFAESQVDAGQRQFDVLVNDLPFLSNLDIAAEAGPCHALVKTLRNVRPQNGRVQMSLRKGAVGEPTICGIELIPELQSPTSMPSTSP